jgi:hypothetical protein
MLKAHVALVIVLILSGIPATGSALTGEVTGHNDDERISLIIATPRHQEVWIDVVPPEVAVVGEASSSSGIRSIIIRDSLDEVSCGNDTRFACSIPVSKGENTIIIIVEDNAGNIIEKELNVIVHIGLPPPPLIIVSGRLTDTIGNPVSGAMITFESGVTLTKNKISKPVSVISNITGKDGGYFIEDAVGYMQGITIKKNNQTLYQSSVLFKNTTNQLNIELELKNKETSGFGFPLAFCSLGIVFAVFSRRRD